MYYLFVAMPAAKTPVHFIKVKNYRKLRRMVQSFQSSALFIFNETTDEVNILSSYYEVIECSYFIYSLLGIYKLTKDLKVSYPINLN